MSAHQPPVDVSTAQKWHHLALTHCLIHTTSRYPAVTPPMDAYQVFSIIDGSKLFQMRVTECPMPVDLLLQADDGPSSSSPSAIIVVRPPDLDTDLLCKHLRYSLLDWRNTAQEAAERQQAEKNPCSTVLDVMRFFQRADDELSAIVSSPRQYRRREPGSVPAYVPANVGVEGFACAVFWLCVAMQAKAERALTDKEYEMSLAGASATAAAEKQKPTTGTAGRAARVAPHHQHMYDAAVGGRVWREALLEVLRPDEHLGEAASLGDALLNRAEQPRLQATRVASALNDHHDNGRTDEKANTNNDAECDEQQQQFLRLQFARTRRVVDLAALSARVGGSLNRNSCVVLSLLLGGASCSSEALEQEMLEREQKRPNDDAAVSIDDAMHILCVRRAADLDSGLLDDLVKRCRLRVARWIGERFSPLAFPSRGGPCGDVDPTAKYFRPYLLRSFFRVVATATARVMTRIFSTSVTGGAVTSKAAMETIRRWTTTTTTNKGGGGSASSSSGCLFQAPLEVAHAEYVRLRIEQLLLETASLPVSYAMMGTAAPSSELGSGRGTAAASSPLTRPGSARYAFNTAANAAVAQSAAPSAARRRETDNNNSSNCSPEQSELEASSSSPVRGAAVVRAASASSSPRTHRLHHHRHHLSSASSSAVSATAAASGHAAEILRAEEKARRVMHDALLTALQTKKPHVLLIAQRRVGGQLVPLLQDEQDRRRAKADAEDKEEKQRRYRQEQEQKKLLMETQQVAQHFQIRSPRPPGAANDAEGSSQSEQQHRQRFHVRKHVAGSREAMRAVIDADHGELCGHFGDLETVVSKLERQRMQQLLQLQNTARNRHGSANERAVEREKAAASAQLSAGEDDADHPGAEHQQPASSARIPVPPPAAATAAATARDVQKRAAARLADRQVAAEHRRHAAVLDHNGLSVGACAVLQDPDEFMGAVVPTQPQRRVVRLTPHEAKHVRLERDALRCHAQAAIKRVGAADAAEKADREDEDNRRLLVRFKRPVSMQAPADLHRAAVVAVERARAESARARLQNVSARHHTVAALRAHLQSLLPRDEADLKQRCGTSLRTQEYYGQLHGLKSQIDAELSGLHGATNYTRKDRGELRLLALAANRLACSLKRRCNDAVAEWEAFNRTKDRPEQRF